MPAVASDVFYTGRAAGNGGINQIYASASSARWARRITVGNRRRRQQCKLSMHPLSQSTLCWKVVFRYRRRATYNQVNMIAKSRLALYR